jgi:hypothetical protein
MNMTPEGTRDRIDEDPLWSAMNLPKSKQAVKVLGFDWMCWCTGRRLPHLLARSRIWSVNYIISVDLRNNMIGEGVTDPPGNFPQRHDRWCGLFTVILVLVPGPKRT